jgi:ABC-type glycerol-3-phosphate transport system permease component
MKTLPKILFFVAIIFIEFSSYAQGCSTCRAQIISSNKEDFTVGNGINTGIIFLMIIPYIILFFLFRKRIKSLYIQLFQSK